MNKIMKTIIPSLLLLFLIACSKPEVKKEALNNQKETPQYSIEQFYKNNRVSGGSFNNEETKLVISSDESGIFNVFEIDIISGQKKQLTFSEKESFFAIDEIPNSDKLIYTADKGGNENNHIYLLNKEGNSTDLTPGDKVKVSFKRWGEDKKSMFYLSNKRDQKYFDLYKMNLNNWKSKMVYKNDKGLNIDDVSHNELIFSISKSITTSEDKLFLLDNKSNKTTEISDEPGSYNGSGFSNDDKYFYYTNIRLYN